MKLNHSFIVIIFLLCCGISASGQENISGLNRKEFSKYWVIESEASDYKANFIGDTLDVVAPKGLTIWRKEKMKGDLTIEYDACIRMQGEAGDRLSDLNCFWNASDPECPTNIFKRAAWRKGIFNHCYSLQLYYLGFGGNHNSTTRFRRYDGNYEAFKNQQIRPDILKEYTDEAHLLRANHWYHVKIEQMGNRTRYYIDGELLVDFRDPNPLTSGWFGFRTTAAHAQVTHFKYTCHEKPKEISLTWIGRTPEIDMPSSWGVPFEQGALTDLGRLVLKTQDGTVVPMESWTLASWPDGSCKWLGMSAVVPSHCAGLVIAHETSGKKTRRLNDKAIQFQKSRDQWIVHTGKLDAYIPLKGIHLMDSLQIDGKTVALGARLICKTDGTEYYSRIDSVACEQQGDNRTVVRLMGMHQGASRSWLPFTVRLYFYGQSAQMKLMHTFVFDGDQDKDFIKGLGIELEVPMHGELYNRHIAFGGDGEGVWSEPVQPLVGRRILMKNGEHDFQQLQMQGKKIPAVSEFDEKNQNLLNNWASWDCFRLSQLSPRAFSIRKRANENRPWIGTIEGNRSNGTAFVGNVDGGLLVCKEDFWQNYPSSLEITGARSEKATLKVWLWSPESEPMDLRHYDDVAHDLNASYEDVQPGMSTPYGIAKTSTLQLMAMDCYPGKDAFAQLAQTLSSSPQLAVTSEYLHRNRAFGVWSLPDTTTAFRKEIEAEQTQYLDFYKKAVEENGWYGFWNYGDFMHAYDPVRHEWKYDVGGFAWDNTELASNMWLWYSFLRTRREDVWTMAKAMSRHTGEVDVYHLGENAGLGSRHNVSHWGCGAKEARISQSAWNRFLYYLTADERSGDLMTEVKDAEQKLYTLDPMRLAQPRSLYPCTAPARLRIGPDWLAYAGNWMTEWERTGNKDYRDKIVAGMKSIAALPHGLFTGPKALGFDPKTGIVSSECDTTLYSTNHLMTIMGGFEVMNEMLGMIHLPEWDEAWTDHAARYTDMAWKVSHSQFLIPRLTAYGAYKLKDPKMAERAWSEYFKGKMKPIFKTVKTPQVLEDYTENPTISTNDVATHGLDAIYLMEVLPDPVNVQK